MGSYLPPVLVRLRQPKPRTVHPPHTIISLSLQAAVCPARAEGALLVLVAIQLSVLGLYLPPVLRSPPLPRPPHVIISLPVHTEGAPRGDGALVVLVAVQLSVLGLYLPPL